jgi:hypothetical protein
LVLVHFSGVARRSAPQRGRRERETKSGNSHRCPKRRVPPGLTAIAEELDDVIGRSRQHDDLRNEPIRARIGGIPYEIDCPVEDALFSQKSDEIGL